MRALTQFDEIEPLEFEEYTPDYPSLKAVISMAHAQLGRQIRDRSSTAETPDSKGDIHFGL